MDVQDQKLYDDLLHNIDTNLIVCFHAFSLLLFLFVFLFEDYGEQKQKKPPLSDLELNALERKKALEERLNSYITHDLTRQKRKREEEAQQRNAALINRITTLKNENGEFVQDV